MAVTKIVVKKDIIIRARNFALHLVELMQNSSRSKLKKTPNQLAKKRPQFKY